MAFIKSKKMYAMLTQTEDGRNIILRAPKMSDDELQNAIDNLINKTEDRNKKEKKEYENNEREKENVNKKMKVIRYSLSNHFDDEIIYGIRKSKEEDYNIKKAYDLIEKNELNEEKAKSLFVKEE